jgi:teichoic acid transport system ATP-binding protein
MKQRYDRIVDFAEIGQFIDQPVKTYSSGMTVRLAFAVNASVDPEILIVDEALAVGDAVFVAKCFQRFHEMRARGTTVILVTHDVATVIQLCDRALVLHQGQQVASGSPKTMADEYRRFCSGDLGRAAPPAIFPQAGNDGREEWCEASSTRDEYGDGGAKIVAFAIRDSVGNPTTKLLSGQECTLHMRIVFHSPCIAPIAAWGIRDMNGNDLCGTNTMFEKIPFEQVTAGEAVDVKFRFRFPLQSGVYHLCLACTEVQDNGLRVLHRMYDACVIEAHATKQFVGHFSLDCETQLLRIESP